MPSASSPDSGAPGGDDARALLLAPSLAADDARATLRRYGFGDPEAADRLLQRIADGPDERRELLACAHRDYVLGCPLERTVSAISRLAEVVIEAGLDLAAARLRARLPGLPPGPLPVAVVALGKLGGGELNYSSDVDLLFV